MEDTRYGIRIQVQRPFAETLDRTTAALKAQASV